MTQPSPEAALAVIEARRARAECENSLPTIIDVSEHVAEQIEGEQFYDMIRDVFITLGSSSARSTAA